MRRIELVFGLSRRDLLDLDETQWLAFIDRDVTPRFPKGLTVIAGQGQWRNSSGIIIREPSRILLIWETESPDLDLRIDAVRAAWKTAHKQDSVLRADGASCVSL